MTDQTTEPAATWDVTASVTVTNLSAADGARFALADVVNRIAAAGVATDTAVEMHRNPPASDDPPRLSPYSETLAREIATELHRLEQDRAQQIDQIIAADIATESAAYDAANTAARQAAAGLDDQDWPATRARLWARNQPDGVLVLAHHSDRWWWVDVDEGDENPGWYPAPTPPQDELAPLGWVEIPHAAPAASEEHQAAVRAARTYVDCTQCGQPWTARACGPTHASIAGAVAASAGETSTEGAGRG